MPQTVLPSEKVIPRPLGRPGSFCQSVKICSCKQWLRYGKGSKKYDFCFGCRTRKIKEKNVFYWIKICFVVCWTKMSLILTPPAPFLAKHFVKRNAFQFFFRKAKKGRSVLTKPAKDHVSFCQVARVFRHKLRGLVFCSAWEILKSCPLPPERASWLPGCWMTLLIIPVKVHLMGTAERKVWDTKTGKRRVTLFGHWDIRYRNEVPWFAFHCSVLITVVCKGRLSTPSTAKDVYYTNSKSWSNFSLLESQTAFSTQAGACYSYVQILGSKNCISFHPFLIFKVQKHAEFLVSSLYSVVWYLTKILPNLKHFSRKKESSHCGLIYSICLYFSALWCC